VSEVPGINGRSLAHRVLHHRFGGVEEDVPVEIDEGLLELLRAALQRAHDVNFAKELARPCESVSDLVERRRLAGADSCADETGLRERDAMGALK